MTDNFPDPSIQPVRSGRVRPREVVYRTAEPVNERMVTEVGSSGLVEYWRVLLRHKGTLLLIGFLGAIVGYLFTVSDTPVYLTHATVEVQGINENFLNIRDVNPLSSGYSIDPAADILTVVKLMESASLREKVVAKLKKKGMDASSPSFGTSRLDAWKAALHIGETKPATWESALDMAADSLKVRATGTTRIMDVSAESTDPKIAAEFVNAIVREFIDQDVQSRLTTTEQTSEWLVRQLDDLKVKLEKSEDQLQAYAEANGIQMTSGTDKEGNRENVTDEKLRRLQTEMLAAQSERIKAESNYELVSAAPADSLPQVVDDDSLRELQSKLAELRRQSAELTTTLTAQNPKVKKVRVQIDELEASLAKERANVVKKIENEYKAADRREQLVTADYNRQLQLVNAQAAKGIHYDILKREADTNHQIYEAVLQKVKEAGVASALRSSSYRALDPANPPASPYKPNPGRSSLMGAVGGLMIGIMFILVRERADHSLQQPGDSMLYLNIQELGVIPSDRSGTVARIYGRDAGAKLIGPSGKPQGAALTMLMRRPPLIAESVHDTLTSILFLNQSDSSARLIVLSSASPSEGKTTISTNLAIALAEINRRVLLIDADMRRPRLHKIFNVPNDQGLSTVLKRPTQILDLPNAPLISQTEAANLFVMTSGPALATPSNLLYSPRLAELFDTVAKEYDFVLIDTPPMLQLADARIISQHCDGIILVVRAGKTMRNTARAACQKLQQDGTPILGTILNDWVPGRNGYGYDSTYYDKYSKYYKVKKS